MVIERSSRREALGDVLTARLAGATPFRIAGYFQSSLLEVVGEALEEFAKFGVCNGDLDPYDVKVAKAARRPEALARTLVSSRQSTEDASTFARARTLPPPTTFASGR
jgi:hypothetical protein